MKQKEAPKAKPDPLYTQVQRRLVASLLSDSTNASRVLEIVTAEDFEEPSLEIIFASAVEIARRNETISPVSIAAELEATGMLQAAGGSLGLYQLREEGAQYLMEAPPELYAAMVKESSTKYKVNNVLAQARDQFKIDSGTSAKDGISGLQNLLNDELYKLSDESTSSAIQEDFDEYLSIIEERERVAKENEGSQEGLQGIPSLLPSINHYTTGWLPGQLVTVGARTGVGKSVFAVNCAAAAAQAGKSVLFFSLEMGRDELLDRITSSVSGVLLSHLRQGSLTAEEKVTLQEIAPEIKKMKIKIETEARVTLDSIRAKALRQAQTAEGLDFIIIDYLQLITPTGRFSSRQEAVADISRNVKLLAKQLEVPIMVLVQVNREGKEDENPIPKLSQIRESGAIAQDSDIVILLHREETLDDAIPQTLVLLEKNRNGEAQKTVRCHSNLECSLFREVIRNKDVDRVTDEDAAAALEELDMDEFKHLSSDEDDFDSDDLDEMF